MAARQYQPFIYKILKIPLIVYPVKDENPLEEVFDPSDHSSIQNHLIALYNKFSQLASKGHYHIVFVWNLEKHRMIDIWIHDMKNWSDSGPLVECLTFRGLETCQDAGIASGDSLIALGREEEFRRSVKNLDEYLDRDKDDVPFPTGMQPAESFYR